MNIYYIKKFHLSAIISVIILCFGQQSFAHSWMAPKNETEKKNPIPASSKSIKTGQILFKDLCSSCHGLNAKGLKKDATDLTKNTPNLTTRLKSHSDGDFHWKILNGKGEMPSFKEDLTKKEIWDIINHIKTLE